MLRPAILLSLMLCAVAAAADTAPGPGKSEHSSAAPITEPPMYQWRSPDSGSVHFSSTPPPWYRGTQPGPRVLVYQDGRLLDDTAVPVSDDRRRSLRQAAFRASRQYAQEQALRRLEQVSAREERRKRREKAEKAKAQQPQPSAPAATAAASPPALDRGTVDRLKAIISEWDREHAAGAGESAGGAAPQ